MNIEATTSWALAKELRTKITALRWSPCRTSGPLPRAGYLRCRAPYKEAFLELDTSYLPTCLMYFTGCPNEGCLFCSQPYWCPVLEVYPGSSSGLPPRSLLSHLGHQRSQFTPLIERKITLCSFSYYLHNPGPCILGGWPQ